MTLIPASQDPNNFETCLETLKKAYKNGKGILLLKLLVIDQKTGKDIGETIGKFPNFGTITESAVSVQISKICKLFGVAYEKSKAGTELKYHCKNHQRLIIDVYNEAAKEYGWNHDSTSPQQEYEVPDMPSGFNPFRIGNITIPIQILFGTPDQPINNGEEDIKINDKPDIFLEKTSEFKEKFPANMQERLLNIQAEKKGIKDLHNKTGTKVRIDSFHHSKTLTKTKARIDSFHQGDERDGDRRGLITLEFSRVDYKTMYFTNLSLDIPIIDSSGETKTIRELYVSENFTDLSESILANPGSVDVAVICENKNSRQLIIRKRGNISLYRGWYQVSATGYIDASHKDEHGAASPFVTAAIESNQEIAGSLEAKPSDFNLIGLGIRWIDLYPSFFGYIETNKSDEQLIGDFCRDPHEGSLSTIPFTPESVLEHIANNKWVAFSALCAIATLLKFFPRDEVKKAACNVQEKNWRDFIEYETQK
ncbi:hypothetical protein VB711_26305 [Cronbergia sp. UHCC 0137]|uniref:hypothetical protein n=1 Tax=Cronbergia sp. UHCC 0137 TaxID=3110239 RepID=UPI002B21A416|nr:hypothetical protein [Cronbergia sp. UHCC 0137]MEA5621319.1 hypothetical protein [Cronbergia sp. UHCC 0137]